MKVNLNQNYLQQIPENQLLAFNKEQGFTWSELKAKILQHRAFIGKNSAEFWVLYQEEPFEFLARLLALWSCKKKVILPANKQPQTIESIKNSIQAPVESYPENINYQSLTSDDTSLILSPESNLFLFTSGSSGEPKCVHKTLENLWREIEQLESLWGDKFTKVISTVSHQHLYGLLFRLLWPFFLSKSFANYQIQYPEELSQLEEKAALVTSPAILSRLDAKVCYSTFSEIFSSGGPLQMEASDSATELLGNRPIEVYGSTETGGIAYRRQCHENTPWQLFSTVLLEQKGDEFYISSPFIIEKELKLDDRLEPLTGNQFILLGRKDRIIKLEEKRLSLEQMEVALENSEWIDSAKCLMLEQPKSRLAVVAELSIAGKQLLLSLGKRELVKMLKLELLESFELVVLPKKWRFVDTIITNSMNKVVLSELQELFK